MDPTEPPAIYPGTNLRLLSGLYIACDMDSRIDQSRQEVTKDDYRRGRCDFQGIKFNEASHESFLSTASSALTASSLTNIGRDRYRELRRRHYNNYRNTKDTLQTLQDQLTEVTPGHQFYRFEYASLQPTEKCYIAHFQLRNLLCATGRNDVFYVHEGGVRQWSPSARQSRPVLSLKSERTVQMMSTLAARNDLLFTGGIRGDYALRNLTTGATHQGILTNLPNGILNYADIVETAAGPPCLFVSSNDQHIRVLDPITTQVMATYKFPFSVNGAAVSPDGKMLATVGDTCETILLDPATGRPQSVLVGHLDYSFACTWSPDGRYLVTGNQDRTARIYDIRNPKYSLHVLSGHMGSVRTLKFSPDGRYLAMAESADHVHLVDVCQDFRRSQVFDFFGDVGGVAFTPDAESLFIGVRDYQHGSPLLQFQQHHHRQLPPVPRGTSANSGGPLSLSDNVLNYFISPTSLQRLIASPHADDQINSLLLLSGSTPDALPSYNVPLPNNEHATETAPSNQLLSLTTGMRSLLHSSDGVGNGPRPSTFHSHSNPHNHTEACLVCAWDSDASMALPPTVPPKRSFFSFPFIDTRSDQGSAEVPDEPLLHQMTVTPGSESSAMPLGDGDNEDSSLWHRVTSTIQSRARALGISLPDPEQYEWFFDSMAMHDDDIYQYALSSPELDAISSPVTNQFIMETPVEPTRVDQIAALDLSSSEENALLPTGAGMGVDSAHAMAVTGPRPTPIPVDTNASVAGPPSASAAAATSPYSFISLPLDYNPFASFDPYDHIRNFNERSLNLIPFELRSTILELFPFYYGTSHTSADPDATATATPDTAHTLATSSTSENHDAGPTITPSEPPLFSPTHQASGTNANTHTLYSPTESRSAEKDSEPQASPTVATPGPSTAQIADPEEFVSHDDASAYGDDAGTGATATIPTRLGIAIPTDRGHRQHDPTSLRNISPIHPMSATPEQLLLPHLPGEAQSWSAPRSMAAKPLTHGRRGLFGRNDRLGDSAGPSSSTSLPQSMPDDARDGAAGLAGSPPPNSNSLRFSLRPMRRRPVPVYDLSFL
ncbi:hypothetical protein H4R34_000427 [Dimargaris verticillata]|uniref:DUF2415 domain-containing protein n=1 Tax=Dimargaris verticillata TaxID=2761393 RepID=A0A9W8EFY1_9FUNG|nr:hypothetical protein H4R34_000427 [Dimargaris verticillata]